MPEPVMERLGLSQVGDPTELRTRLCEDEAATRQLLAQAETDAARAKFSARLDDLAQALAALGMAAPGEPLGGEPSPTQLRDLPAPLTAAGRALSHSQRLDLPVAATSRLPRPDAAAATPAPGGSFIETPGQQSPRPVHLQTGDVLASRYEILRELGRGGMGIVYAVRDSVRQEEIALKILHPALADDPTSKARFTQEGRLATSLAHGGIVRVYDLQEADGCTFLTMELLAGRTLRAEMLRRAERSQRFSLEEIQGLIRSLGEALAYAHRSTVHCDIKPENIWLCPDDSVKLMDFGIARAVRPSEFTTRSIQLGTAYYMAPEQLRGAKSIDARADQFSLAVVAYELLTGEIPQGAIQAPHLVRRSVPASMSQAVMRGLAGQPERRFDDMTAFCAALCHGRRRVSRRVKRLCAAAALLVVVSAAATQSYWREPALRWWKTVRAGETVAAATAARDAYGVLQPQWQEQAQELPAGAQIAQFALAEQAAAEASQAWDACEFARAESAWTTAQEQLTAAIQAARQLEKAWQDYEESAVALQQAEAAWRKLADPIPALHYPPQAATALRAMAQAADLAVAHDYVQANELAEQAAAGFSVATERLVQFQTEYLAAERALAELPEPLWPAAWHDAQQQLAQSAEAVARVDEVTALAAYDVARDCLTAVPSSAVQQQKKYDEVAQLLRELDGAELGWQKIAPQDPPNALGRRVRAAADATELAREDFAEYQLADALASAERSLQLWQSVTTEVQQGLAAAAAAGQERAERSVAAADQVAEDLQEQLADSQRIAERLRDQGTADEREEALQLVDYRAELWEQYQDDEELNRDLEEAHAELAAGAALLRSDPSAAQDRFDRAVELADTVCAWRDSEEADLVAQQAADAARRRREREEARLAEIARQERIAETERLRAEQERRAAEAETERLRAAAYQYYATVCINNAEEGNPALHYQIRWKHFDGTWSEWESKTLEYGYLYTHYSLGAIHCQMKVDVIGGDDDVTEKIYRLDFESLPSATEPIAGDGQDYYFKYRNPSSLFLSKTP